LNELDGWNKLKGRRNWNSIMRNNVENYKAKLPEMPDRNTNGQTEQATSSTYTHHAYTYLHTYVRTIANWLPARARRCVEWRRAK